MVTGRFLPVGLLQEVLTQLVLDLARWFAVVVPNSSMKEVCCSFSCSANTSPLTDLVVLCCAVVFCVYMCVLVNLQVRSLDDFFDRLQSGVELCDLVNTVAPELHCPCNRSAKPYTFQATDNIGNFLRCAKVRGWRLLVCCAVCFGAVKCYELMLCYVCVRLCDQLMGAADVSLFDRSQLVERQSDKCVPPASPSLNRHYNHFLGD
jgi:hypothetical protein